MFQDGGDAYELAGLAKGGQQLKRLKANYQKAINLLVELASLQTSFITLDEVRISKSIFLNDNSKYFTGHQNNEQKSECYRACHYP